MALHTPAERPLAMRIIIGYKLAKAVAVFALAIVLTVASGVVFREARHLTANLLEHGGLLHRLALWMQAHLTVGFVKTVRLLAWLDGATTALEAGLLLSGKTWGEWLVIAGLAALLPFEAHAAVVHQRPGHFLVLIANAAIVIYLVHRQVAHHKLHTAHHA